MLKKSENNGTEEIGLVTPTPVHIYLESFSLSYLLFINRLTNDNIQTG